MTKKPAKPPKKPDKKSKSVVLPAKRGAAKRQTRKGAKPRAIDIHPDREQIIARILKGESLPSIERAYGLGKGVAWRYVTEVLAERVQEAVERQKDDLEAEIRQIMARVMKLSDACDAWLADPTNPEQYTLCPRMDEVEIVYEAVNGNGNIVNKKALLSTLLARCVPDGDENVVEVKFKQADPRNLLIDAANSMKGNIEVIAKILGKIKPGGDSLTVNVNQSIVKINAVVVKALARYPEARAAVVKELSRIQDERSAS